MHRAVYGQGYGLQVVVQAVQWARLWATGRCKGCSMGKVMDYRLMYRLFNGQGYGLQVDVQAVQWARSWTTDRCAGCSMGKVMDYR